MEKLKDMLGTALAVPLMIGWTFGGFIGAVYWAVDGYLLGVVLSIFVPLYGAVSVLIDLFTY